jgi:aryl sulfotransferase
VVEPPYRYQASDEDSGRWNGFAFRDGDIVISTRSKSGTTWMQMICALLVFQDRELPAPLSELSPWLDWLVEPVDIVSARLEAQQHRRFIKTHTPLDGIPLDPKATYIVVAREPLDVAVSMYHHSANLDRQRLHELTGAPLPPTDRLPERDWLVAWIERDVDPQEATDSFPGVIRHASDAWARRDRPNIVLVHYTDLSNDLDGEMRRIAGALEIEVAESRWPALVKAATFAEMRGRAADVVPDRLGVVKDPQAFFRRGRSGAGRALLGDADYERYLRRMSSLGSPELIAWLHRDGDHD